MDKPLIAVTASHQYGEKGPGQACLGLQYLEAVEANGGMAILASGREQMAEALARRVDGCCSPAAVSVAPGALRPGRSAAPVNRMTGGMPLSWLYAGQ